MDLKSIGNIGAHSEKNIDILLDIDVGEVNQLIKFIEILIEEWYTKRETRRVHLLEIKGIAEKMKLSKK